MIDTTMYYLLLGLIMVEFVLGSIRDARIEVLESQVRDLETVSAAALTLAEESP